MANEVEELEQVISVLDTLYEEGNDCIHPITGEIVPDAEYDKLRKRLKELNPESQLFKTPTASTVPVIKKVRHDPPMTSISKAIGSLPEREETLKKFQDDVSEELNYTDPPEKWMVQAYKRDGVAIALYYEHGKLVCAGLRPRNGYEGEDVTQNATMVEGIPTELWEHDRDGTKIRPLDVNCCIRGEVECKKSTFRKIKEDWQNPIYDLNQEPKNPRNYTAGSIRQFSNPKITKERKLSFVGYSIVGWYSNDNSPPPFKTEIERAKYSNAVLRIPFVQVRPYRQQDLKVLETIANNLDYEVDGIVLSVNNLEDAEQMGNVGGNPTGNPKAKLAWKFSEQTAITTVRSIEWQVGRTGTLTPVLHVDPVQLDGTTVSQCTGHSLGFVNGKSKASLGEITTGAEICIIKSGKIIPKVVHIIKNGWQSFHHPHKCPSCNNVLEVQQGGDGQELVCTNDFCGVRAVAQYAHYLTTFGVKGIAESTLTKMFENGMLKDFSDLYGITQHRLERIGFSRRQALQTVARIWLHPDPTHADDDALAAWIVTTQRTTKVKIPSWQFLSSLGIPGVGKAAAQALISHFGDFTSTRRASYLDLQKVDGVAEVSARAIFEYFGKNRTIIDNLLEYVEPENPKVGKFTGKTFVFSGGFPGGKQKWEKEVTERGGKVTGSVSKTTDYLVVGTDAGSKEEKAIQLGIARLSLADLEKML